MKNVKGSEKYLNNNKGLGSIFTNFVIFQFNIRGKLSLIRCDK